MTRLFITGLLSLLLVSPAFAASFTAVASSTFTTDENPLSESGVWTTPVTGMSNVMKKLSGVAQSAGFGADAAALYTGASFNACQYSRAQLTVSAAGAGGGRGSTLNLLQQTGADTGYRFQIDHNGTTNAYIERHLAGVITNKTSWLQAFTDGDQFTFAVCNEVLYVYDKTNTLVKTVSDVGGGVATTGTPGIGYSSAETSASVDNWEGGNFSPGIRGGAVIFFQ